MVLGDEYNCLALFGIRLYDFRRHKDSTYASLPYRGTPKSVEEIEAGITAEARRRHARD